MLDELKSSSNGSREQAMVSSKESIAPDEAMVLLVRLSVFPMIILNKTEKCQDKLSSTG
jgi:hypothetical protein